MVVVAVDTEGPVVLVVVVVADTSRESVVANVCVDVVPESVLVEVLNGVAVVIVSVVVYGHSAQRPQNGCEHAMAQPPTNEEQALCKHIRLVVGPLVVDVVGPEVDVVLVVVDVVVVVV